MSIYFVDVESYLKGKDCGLLGLWEGGIFGNNI